MSGWLAGYSLGCQPVDYSNSPQALRVSYTGTVYYWLRPLPIEAVIILCCNSLTMPKLIIYILDTLG